MPKDTTNKTRLTNPRVAAFAPPPGKREATLWDTDAAGLGVRAQGERKTFVFMSRLSGKLIKITLGTMEAWTLEDARKEARRLQALIATGTDPREERRRTMEAEQRTRKARERAAVAFREAWGTYIEDRRGDWSERHLKDHNEAMSQPGLPRKRSRKKTVAGPLWPLRDVKLSDLNPELIRGLLAKESKKRPTMTARAYRLLRAFLKWAEQHPDYSDIFRADDLLKSASRHVKKSSKPRSDVLQVEQLRAWFASVAQIGNPAIGAYLQVLLITGARPGEIRALKWEDVDLQWKTLRIRDKAEGERLIPLTPYVGTLLAALPRRNQWVFTSGRNNAPLAPPSKQHKHALEAAGLPHVTLHGLRRTFASVTEWVEVPAGVVAQIMGHKPSATAEKHYKVRPVDLLRKWHTKIEAWILDQAGIEQPEAIRERLEVVE